MRREALLMVPEADNNGRALPDLLPIVVGQAVDVFGGATVRKGAQGAWRGPDGRLYIDPMAEVVIACEDTPKNRSALRSLAIYVCAKAEQAAVYLRLPAGDVEFVEIDPMSEALTAAPPVGMDA